MTVLNYQLTELDNSIGLDLLLDGNGDLTIDSDGDIKSVTGANNLASSLRRRLTTAPQGYSRLIKDPDSYAAIDSNYGSSLTNYLSMPLDEGMLMDMLQIVEAVVMQDSRIQNVQASITSTTLNSTDMQVYYAPKAIADIPDNTVGSFPISGFVPGTTNQYSFVLPVG